MTLPHRPGLANAASSGLGWTCLCADVASLEGPVSGACPWCHDEPRMQCHMCLKMGQARSHQWALLPMASALHPALTPLVTVIYERTSVKLPTRRGPSRLWPGGTAQLWCQSTRHRGCQLAQSCAQRGDRNAASRAPPPSSELYASRSNQAGSQVQTAPSGVTGGLTSAPDCCMALSKSLPILVSVCPSTGLGSI